MSLDFGEFGAQKINSFVSARFSLLVMRHRALPVQHPETNFGVNLERPLLAIRRDHVVHQLDFRAYVERLLTQAPSRPLPIDGTRRFVGLCLHCGSTRRGEDAAATRRTEFSAGFLVASSGTIEEPDRDVDGNASEIIGTFSQQCWEIDHLDRSDERWEFDLEANPSFGCATSIDACDEHCILPPWCRTTPTHGSTIDLHEVVIATAASVAAGSLRNRSFLIRGWLVPQSLHELPKFFLQFWIEIDAMSLR